MKLEIAPYEGGGRQLRGESARGEEYTACVEFAAVSQAYPGNGGRRGPRTQQGLRLCAHQEREVRLRAQRRQERCLGFVLEVAGRGKTVKVSGLGAVRGNLRGEPHRHGLGVPR